jgi:hypothetical protein
MPRYTYNGKTYNVPDAEVKGFLSRKPNAKPIEDGAPFMTSVGITSDTRGSQPQHKILTSRESNIPTPTDTTVDENQPAGAYSPQSARISLFQPMIPPKVGPIDTKFAKPEDLFRPKSTQEVIGDSIRNGLAAHMADPAVQFERALQVYRDSGEYERDKAKEVGEQSLPPVAHEWLEKNKPQRDRSQGVLTERWSGQRAERKDTEQDNTDLVNRFIANSNEGRNFAAEHAEQVKWLNEQIATLEAKIEDSEKNAPRVKKSQYVQTSSGQYGNSGYWADIEVPENYDDLSTARTQLVELNNLRDAIKDGDRTAVGQFWGELKRRAGAGVIDIATLGISDPLLKAGVNRALQNPENTLTREATDLLGQYQSLHANERSIAQDIAQGTYGSLAFMAQFAATGGIAAGITKGASTAIASKLGGSLAAKAVGKMGQTVGDAFVRTALSPSTLAGAYELNMQNPGSFLDAYSQKFTQNLIEFASEGMGAAMPGAKIFGGAKTRFGRTLSKVGGYTGVQDIGTEYLEEQFATLGHALTGDGQGSWADFVDPRSQLVTLGSVALMQLPNVTITAGGYAAGKAHNVVQTRSIRRGYDRNRENMTLAFGQNTAEIVGVVDAQIDGAPDTAIPSLITTLAEDTEMNDRQKDAVVKYALSRAAYQGLNRAKTEEIEAAVQRVSPLVEQNVNPQTGTVRTIRISGTDTPVQSLGGNIVRREDGTIDRERSDKQQFYADPETGERKVEE